MSKNNKFHFKIPKEILLNKEFNAIVKKYKSLDAIVGDIIQNAEGLIFKRNDDESMEQNATTIGNFIADSYGGDFLATLYREIYLKTGIVEDGLIDVKETFHESLTIDIIDADFIAKDAVAQFDGSGSALNVRPVKIEPGEYSVMEKIDFKGISKTFLSTLQDFGVYAGFVPPEIVMIAYMLEFSDFQRALTNRMTFAGSARTPKFLGTTPVIGIEQLLGAATNLPYVADTPSLAFTASALSPATYNGVATWTRVTVANNVDINVGDYVTPVGIAGAVGTNMNNAIYRVGNDRAALNTIGNRKTANQIVVLGKSGTTFIDISVTFATATTFNSQNVSGRLAFINKSNAKATLSSFWLNVPYELREDEGFKIMVSPHTFNCLRLIDADALGARILTTEEEVRAFLGMPVYINPYQSPNVIIGAIPKDNFIMGMFLASEGSQLSVVSLKDTELSYLYNFRADFSQGVAVLKPNECLYVRPA